MDRLLLNTIAALNAEDEPHRDLCGFRKNAERMTDLLIDAMFPCYADEAIPRERALSEAAALLRTCLDALSAEPERTDAIVFALFDALPGVLRLLKTDLAAAYVGDPAARGADEIILCYPAFFAIGTYRLAHVLYRKNVPLLPRVMTEYAHRRTGIDIHPGATIGAGPQQKIFTFLQEPHTSRRNHKTCLKWSRYKSWTQRWKVSTFAMEVKRSFFEMKMEHTERSHASRAFEKP